MKKINFYLTMMLFAICGYATNAYAVAESEPNDVWNQADVITLGATGTGTAGLSQNQDWWRVTSTVDGRLTVNWTSTNSLFIFCQIYDTLGVVQFASNYTSTSSVLNVDGLAAGTYYILFYAYYSTEAPTYSFVPTWTTPAQLIDVEPNNTKAQAKTLPLNGSKTGHIGYVFNQVDDLEDWWKVTTNADGRLEWTITSHNGQFVYARLYDNNGTLLFGGSYTSSTAYYSQDGLSAGTYYIKINTYYNNEYAPYTISNNLVLPAVVTDAEPNGLYTQALTIAVNDSAVGHIGYYYNNVDDTLDWYKVTTTLEGRIDIRMRSLNGQNVYMELFDSNGTTYLAGNYTSADNTWSKDGLTAGIYYIRIRNYYISEFAPYKINVSLIPAAVPVDTEPNGTRALAKTININDSITGHIGYMNYLLRDTFDFRKITLTQNGRLTWKLNVLNGQNVYAELFDNNATTLLEGNYTTTSNTWSRADLAPGTYYLRIRTFYPLEFAPYALKTSFEAVSTDTEPNGTLATASTLPLNAISNYCVGYYYNGARDTNDWHKVNLPNDGKLSITLIGKINTTYLQVYDVNGTTQLFSQYVTGPNSVTYAKNDLVAGTYYVLNRQYNPNDFSTYQLVTEYVSNNANDAEPNLYAKQGALICGYTTKSGNIGYTSGTGVVDEKDWFKLGYYTGAPLVINILKVARTWDGNGNVNAKYYLYKDTALAPIDSAEMVGAAGYTKSYSALTAGAYYIKILRTTGYGGYSINAQYLDTCSHTVTQVSAAGGGQCNKGSLKYYITRGRAPYAVQLYRDGAAYGASVTTSDTATYTLLPPGNYYCRVKGNGASTYYVQSKSKALSPTPQNTNATAITNSSAVITWTGLSCVDGFLVSYKKSTATIFTNDTLPGTATFDSLKGLSASTIYNYKVQSFHKPAGTYYKGAYSTAKTFTTLAPRDGAYALTVSDLDLLNIYPNPATDVLNIDVTGDATYDVIITNTLGQNVKYLRLSAGGLTGIDIATFPAGIYNIQIRNDESTQSAMFVKE